MRRQPDWARSWGAALLVTLALLALFVAACGPEATRGRDGGTGGSSRPEAPPTRTSAPELLVQPTANTPYAVEGTLPALRPAAAPGPGSPAATPGFGVPTVTPGTFAVPSPSGASPTPTR